ncbi:MAG: asparagine synthase, partial [Helicobacter sp.]|nr:asparagine synthase [Helicobacter sp.]
LLARDIMGEKPLYYAKTPHSFAFSTLIAPLCWQDSTINPRAIWDFLTFGFIPEPQTIFENIQALPKGTYGVYDINRAEFFIQSFIKQTQRNFSVEFENTDDSLLRITNQIVRESIFDRLLSDVKVGAFLSGGLDSSIVVSIAKQRCETLETFNIAFADNVDPYCGFADESEFAQIIAKHIGLNHHEIRVDSKNYQDYLQDFIASIDQPYGAISGIGIKMIARFARELGIKVLLSGDGADEMFGGYTWYPKLQFNDPRYITQEKPKGWHYYAFESEKRAFLSKDMFSFGGNYFESLHYFPVSSSPIDSIQFDRNFYLPFEMMTKLDRMTMSEGVEGRACFVSPKIFAFIQQLDYQILLRHGTKWLLRESFCDILPQKIVMREKHGFNPPIDYWLHHAWRSLLLEALAPQSALNKLGILSANIEQNFMSIFDKSERRFGNIAFFLVVLNLWLEQYINFRNITR